MVLIRESSKDLFCCNNIMSIKPCAEPMPIYGVYHISDDLFSVRKAIYQYQTIHIRNYDFRLIRTLDYTLF